MKKTPTVCARPVLPDGSQGDAGTYVLATHAERAIACRERTIASLRAEVERLTSAKDGAYEERNRCVALIARMAVAMGYRAGVARTAIEGWSEDWHGCVYIDLPTGQASWHYHDTHAHLFAGLPEYAAPWDGHDTPEKYRRVDAAREFRSAEAERLRGGFERHALKAGECPPDSVVVLVSSMRRLAALQEPTP